MDSIHSKQASQNLGGWRGSIFDFAFSEHENGHEIAIATVIEVWKSSPQPVGAQMVISSSGNFAGSVSGGCVEAAVIQTAQGVMQTGLAKMCRYQVSTDDAFAVGLTCGGQITVLIQLVGGQNGPSWEDLGKLAVQGQSGQSIVYSVDLETFATSVSQTSDSTLPEPVAGVFSHIFQGAKKLVIIGAGHIAQELVPMALQIGLRVMVIDPRGAFANSHRFPNVPCIVEWPDEAMTQVGICANSAVVALSHDDKMDIPALEAAFRSPAFYVGALGSKKTQTKRREALIERGFDQTQIDRISGPVGLDIGARHPAEIAVAILAEIIQAKNRR